jgi:hypothetical protein
MKINNDLTIPDFQKSIETIFFGIKNLKPYPIFSNYNECK